MSLQHCKQYAQAVLRTVDNTKVTHPHRNLGLLAGQVMVHGLPVAYIPVLQPT